MYIYIVHKGRDAEHAFGPSIPVLLPRMILMRLLMDEDWIIRRGTGWYQSTLGL